MEAHQERVIIERRELAEKFFKLGKFIGGDIYNSLSVFEQDRLIKQARVMKEYLDVLDERIAAFPVYDVGTCGVDW